MTNAPTRILFILPSFAGGGAERVVLTLLANLDAAQFAASLLVLDGRGPLAHLVPAHVPVTDLATARLRRALPDLIGFIRKEKPDFVFSTLGYVNLALLAVRLLLPRKSRILVREANMPSLSLPATSHPTLFRAAYRLLYPSADAVICTSSQMADEMSRDFSVSTERLFLIPNPVDDAALRHAATPIVRTPGEGVRLVAAGRLTPQKGFDRLLDWMTALAPSTRLTLLGEGPERAKLEAQAKSLGLTDRVHFAGFCDNPWSHYAGADAFVLASRWEGLPNAALEALACGTPVIATPQSGGIAEISAAASPGAVTIVAAGEAFVAVLTTLPIRPLMGSKPRFSLLPCRYQVTTVAQDFQNILKPL